MEKIAKKRIEGAIILWSQAKDAVNNNLATSALEAKRFVKVMKKSKMAKPRYQEISSKKIPTVELIEEVAILKLNEDRTSCNSKS